MGSSSKENAFHTCDAAENTTGISGWHGPVHLLPGLPAHLDSSGSAGAEGLLEPDAATSPPPALLRAFDAAASTKAPRTRHSNRRIHAAGQRNSNIQIELTTHSAVRYTG